MFYIFVYYQILQFKKNLQWKSNIDLELKYTL